MTQRRQHGGAFKARVAVEAIAGHKTVNEIASAYAIHPSQVGKWKSQALAGLPEILSDGRQVKAVADPQREARLYEQIGRLRMEVEYLKKKAGSLPVQQRRGLIELAGCRMSVREQCRLLSMPRSTLYYEPGGTKAEDLLVMRRLDEQYTATPFYGVERMTAALHRDGLRIGHNRVRRLLRLMGFEAIYPKPRLSVPGGPEHRVYPYLLRGLRIDHVNQVWSSDISVPQKAA